MHIYCPHCAKKFIPEPGPPERQVRCPCCARPQRLVGERPEFEIWAEGWIEILKAGAQPRRREALESLRALGASARRFLPALIEILEKEGTSDSPAIVTAIGNIAGTPVNLKLLNPTEEMREHVGSFEPPDATTIGALKRAFESDRDDSTLRVAVIEVFCQFATGAFLSHQTEFDCNSIYDVLCQGLRDEDAEVRAVSAKALGWLGKVGHEETLVPRLISALDEDEDVDVCTEVLTALISIKAEPTVVLPALARALLDDDPEIAGCALACLTKMGEEARPVVPAIVDLIKSRGPDEWAMLSFALRSIGPNLESVATLAEGLRSDDPWFVELSAEILGAWRADSAKAVPQLITALRHREIVAVRAAVRALGEIGPESRDALPDLVRLLGDSRWNREALHALGGLKHEARSALPQIIVYLNDPDREQRDAAAMAISRIDPQADLLIAGLRPPAPEAPDKQDANIFRREGLVWRITFAGKTNHFPDLRGLNYISILVSDPGEHIHVGDLVAAGAGPREARAIGKGEDEPIYDDDEKRTGGAGYSAKAIGGGAPLIEPQEKARLRLEMEDLQDRLGVARNNKDDAMIEQLECEIDQLKSSSLAMTWRGKSKLLGNEADKIRKAVSKCIKESIAIIHRYDPNLGKHLDEFLDTGEYCIYRPKQSTRWVV